MFNHNKLTPPSQDLIGHRFGTLTVVEIDPDSVGNKLICKCDCGRSVVVNRSTLLCYNQLSCGHCGTRRPQIIEKYGTLSTYINPDNSKVCTHCGSPYVYNAKHNLCKNCYNRLRNRGTTEYYSDIKDSTPQPPRGERAIARRKKAVDSISINPKDDTAVLALNLYTERGYTYQQIANVLGTSRQYVHKILHYNA